MYFLSTVRNRAATNRMTPSRNWAPIAGYPRRASNTEGRPKENELSDGLGLHPDVASWGWQDLAMTIRHPNAAPYCIDLIAPVQALPDHISPRRRPIRTEDPIQLFHLWGVGRPQDTATRFFQGIDRNFFFPTPEGPPSMRGVSTSD
jgi:hypothetical protein